MLFQDTIIKNRKPSTILEEKVYKKYIPELLKKVVSNDKSNV